MPRQSLTVADAIKQANYLSQQGHILPAKQIFSQILARFPQSGEARNGLKQLYRAQINEADEVVGSARQKTIKKGAEQALNEIRHSQYLKDSAAQGWAYTLVVDHAYIDGYLSRGASARLAEETVFDPDRDLVEGEAPGAYLKAIQARSDLGERFRYMQKLTAEHSRTLLADSFVDIPSDALGNDIRNVVSGGKLNVAIIGAGVAGLSLANMLKNTFQGEINVLVLENRVYRPRYKKPYTRNWITNVLLSQFSGVLDEEVIRILEGVGQNGYMGVPINVFETLLLLSCKKLGVQFLFDASSDLSGLDLELDAVFDASGNRFDPAGISDLPDHALKRSSLPMQVKADIARGFTPFAVNPEPCRDIERIDLSAAENMVVPCHDGRPIKTAMVKITTMPASIFEPLMAHIKNHNEDNRFYFWRGTLKDEINEALLIVNLTRPEFNALQAFLEAPMTLTTFIESFPQWDLLDIRFAGVLEKIAEIMRADDQAMIEPPFLYEPFFVPYPQTWSKIWGAPLIRIGDAIYNGHVKCGNGMGPHLFHLRLIHDAFLKAQIVAH